MTGRLLGLILVVLLSSVSVASYARGIDAPALSPLAGTWPDCRGSRVTPEAAATTTPASLSMVHKITLSAPAMDAAAGGMCSDVATQLFDGTAILGLESAVLSPIDHAILSSIDTAQFRHASAATHRDLKSLTGFEADLVVSSGEDPDAETGWFSSIVNSPAAALLALAIIGMAAVARRAPVSVPAGTEA